MLYRIVCLGWVTLGLLTSIGCTAKPELVRVLDVQHLNFNQDYGVSERCVVTVEKNDKKEVYIFPAEEPVVGESYYVRLLSDHRVSGIQQVVSFVPAYDMKSRYICARNAKSSILAEYEHKRKQKEEEEEEIRISSADQRRERKVLILTEQVEYYRQKVKELEQSGSSQEEETKEYRYTVPTIEELAELKREGLRE